MRISPTLGSSPRFWLLPLLFLICLSLKGFAATEKTNVLVLSIDDLRPELGCYGAKHMVTPNIDHLAASSVLFEQAYVQQAVCLPSRVSLFTGMRPNSTGVHDLQTKFRQTIPNALTMPQYFGQHGYKTIGMGKVYHDEKWGEWTRWVNTRELPGVEEYHMQSTRDRIDQLTKEGKAKGLKGMELSRYAKGPAYESADASESGYHDAAMTDVAIEALENVGDEPFFMVVGYKKPHLPFVAPKKYWDLYDFEGIELPQNYYTPKGAPGIAQMTWGELRAYADIPEKGPLDDLTARRLIHGYYASVSFVDAQIGRLMSALEDAGLADNTIVVLWGDHGWKLGEHAMWCKHTNYEVDARVPFLIKAPGFAQGRSAALVELLDLFPTLGELAGLPASEQWEGTSLLPLLVDPDAEWSEFAYTQYPRWGGVMGYSVKSHDGRYTEWIKEASGEVVAREYYDHQLDPHENMNRAGEPAYAGAIETLSSAIAEERERCNK